MSDIQQDAEFSPHMGSEAEVLQPYDARERVGLPPLVKLAILAIGLILIALIVLKLYQPGVRDRSDPPRITADNTPFKVPPKEAGGRQTPNQDKVVFEVMDGKKPTTDTSIQTPPETPIKVEAPAPVVNSVELPNEAPKPSTTASPPQIVAAPAPRPQSPVRSTQPVSNTQIGTSEWVVQVASVRDESDARNLWTGLERKFPNLVSSTASDIKRVDLGDKGVYYRLRVAGLADKTSAQTLCSNLKAGGQDCLVTRR